MGPAYTNEPSMTGKVPHYLEQPASSSFSAMARAQMVREVSSLLPKSVSTVNVCLPSSTASALQAEYQP